MKLCSTLFSSGGPTSPTRQFAKVDVPPESPASPDVLPATTFINDIVPEEEPKPVSPKSKLRSDTLSRSHHYLKGNFKTRFVSILIKIALIGQLIVNYTIDWFNLNSKDYREVSNKLSDMKSEDKRLELERSHTETASASVITMDPMGGGDQLERYIYIDFCSYFVFYIENYFDSVLLKERFHFERLCKTRIRLNVHNYIGFLMQSSTLSCLDPNFSVILPW